MPSLSARLIALQVGAAVAFAAAASSDAKTRKHPSKKAVVAQRAKPEARCRGGELFMCGPLYYNGGEYLGDDPDPNIRFQIWRDIGARLGSPD